jgi:hypothetical protein
MIFADIAPQRPVSNRHSMSECRFLRVCKGSIRIRVSRFNACQLHQQGLAFVSTCIYFVLQSVYVPRP